MKSNIVHQYFKKEIGEVKIIVKVDPIHLKGTELTVFKDGRAETRNLQFDEEIMEDLKVDGFEACSAIEFNLYLAGLA